MFSLNFAIHKEHENEAGLYLVCILEIWIDSFETWCAGYHRVWLIENEIVTGKSKISEEFKNGDFWATGGYICGRWATD
jgi:hypothetical protein